MATTTAQRLVGLISALFVTPLLAAFALPTGTWASDTSLAPFMVLAEAVPVPRLNPRRQASDPIGTLIDNVDDQSGPTSREDRDPLESVGFTLAVERLRQGDPAGATIAAYALSDRVSADLVDWLIATSGDDQVPSNRIAEIAPRFADWPGTSLIRLRLEQALRREERSDAEVLAALDGQTPETDAAALAVGRALRAAGRDEQAAELIRDMWRKDNLDASVEKEIIGAFAGLLSADDHKVRMDRLLYDGHAESGLRAAKALDKTQQDLAAAVAAVIKRKSVAGKLLSQLPKTAKADPLYLYSRIQLLRRADKANEAADLLAEAPTDQSVLKDPDAWWVERRIVSRSLAEDGDVRRAYEIAAGHSAESSGRRAEAEFHAGWFALEYLGDAETATRHFAEIVAIASRPLSLSRAEYWLGRAALSTGSRETATKHFGRAAAYPATFYGQLALAEIGAALLPITTAAAPEPTTLARFDDRRFVRVIRHLLKANYVDRTGAFFRRLAGELDDPAEVRLLSEMAEAAGQHQFALQVGIIASVRGLPVDDLAFTTAAIPAKADTGDVEKAVVYAIARQESRFNQEAISRAGARGLLQLMPGTAKETARGLGLSYSRSRLTSDPAYNATLGATYLGKMIDRFDGSYVMTFAAYNAGASRVDQWVERFGDPRDPKVDVVNWIESIPFTETRNYVQRIMENLQVYRARFGDRDMAIHRDLRRRNAG